jgi:DNA-binding NtrC family response regulator
MNIIVIDDQEELRYSVAKIISESKHKIYEFEGNEDDLIEKILQINPSLILLDVQLQGKSGIDILKDLKLENKTIPVVLMTAYTTPTNIIEATKLGVRDILQKPFEADYLLEIVEKYVINNDIQSIEFKIDNSKESFIGSYKTMGEIYKKVGMIASNDLSIMIRGETGTGKELIAKLIHQHSNRFHSPFVTINCAAIPNELFEGEFFGYEKGSFTGAEKKHIGYLESANGGVVFLDEIGEMPLFMQAKLLRFLETKTIKRLGSSTEIALDVKIVSATNIDIEKSISKESFREDLYYRLSSLFLELPPLSQRKEDIPLLVSHFIKLANKDLGANVKGITKDAMDALISYQWQGNIRELKNIITNGVLQAIGTNITIKDLRIEKTHQNNISFCIDDFIVTKILDLGIDNAHIVMDEIQSKVINTTIKLCDGNITKASVALNMARNTLKSKIGKDES